MARIKYNSEIVPLINKHYGYTFQPGRYGQVMMRSQPQARARYLLQFEKMQYMSKAVRNWRNQSPEFKTAWSDFAEAYPQPSKRDPNVFLTGYQLFLKRYFYFFLHEGITEDFNLLPILTELPDPEFEIRIIEDGQCVDVTAEYIRNFGLLPEPGQFIICRIVPMSAISGQFFSQFTATLEVLQVYLDGLFLTLDFSANFDNIIFSIYLSYPVSQGLIYPGTKFRYMGCFKPTTFIQLSDTPSTYEGQAGKIPIVKEDETGLEFDDPGECDYCLPTPTIADAGKVATVNETGDGYELKEAGGGGLTCEDLPECPAIANLLTLTNAIAKVIVLQNQNTIPATNFGLYYNWFFNSAFSNLVSSDAWRLPTHTEWLALKTYIGGASIAGGLLKATGFTWWDSPNTGATDDYNFSARGAGTRSSSGTFGVLKRGISLMSSTEFDETRYQCQNIAHSSVTMSNFAIAKKSGVSIRLVSSASGVSDGSFVTYTGNNLMIYTAVAINGLYWLTANLAETYFRNGSAIPIVTDNIEWAALETPAISAPGNDWNNV